VTGLMLGLVWMLCWCPSCMDYGDPRVRPYGLRLLKAIYAFKSRHGLWPEYLADLREVDPGLKKTEQPSIELRDGTDTHVVSAVHGFPAWWYRWGHGGGFSLNYGGRGFAQYYYYKVTVGDDGSEFVRAKDFPEIDHASLRPPVGEKVEEALSELSRRIRREPDWFEHYWGRTIWLLRAGRLREASDLLRQCLKMFPKRWSVRLALVDIEARLRMTEGKGEWPEEFPKTGEHFEDDYLYFHFLERTQQNDDAIAVLQRAKSKINPEEPQGPEQSPKIETSAERDSHSGPAVKGIPQVPIAVADERLRGWQADFAGQIPEWCILNAVGFLYEQNTHELGLEILEKGMYFFGNDPTRETTSCRAALYLALGDLDRAEKQAKVLRGWPALSVEQSALLRAVELGDTSLRCDLRSMMLPDKFPFEYYE